MSTTPLISSPTPLHALGRIVLQNVSFVGDVTVFALEIMRWMIARVPRRNVLLPCLYQTGVRSLPVVIVTLSLIHI